jgi:hypothetical protein
MRLVDQEPEKWMRYYECPNCGDQWSYDLYNHLLIGAWPASVIDRVVGAEQQTTPSATGERCVE